MSQPFAVVGRAAMRAATLPRTLAAHTIEAVQRVSAAPPSATPTKRRHVARLAGRAHIQIHGIHGPDGFALARALHRALTSVEGVDDAVVNATLSGAFVAFDEDAVSVDDLLDIVEALEHAHNAVAHPEAARPPSDPAPLRHALVNVGVDVIGTGVAVAGWALRLPRLPMEATAIVGVVEAAPRLRRPLERTFGEVPVDAAFGLTLTATRALAHGVAGVLADLALRTIQAREADARLRAWFAGERELHAASPDVVRPVVATAPSGVPPFATYANRSTATAALLAAVTFAGTANPRRAAGILMAGTPKAGKVAPEAFAGTLGRRLSEQGVQVLAPSALRELSRVDTVVLDASALVTGRSRLERVIPLREGVDVDEMYLRALALIDPDRPQRVSAAEDWRVAPPDDIASDAAERLRPVERHHRTAGELVLAVLHRGALVGAAVLAPELHPAAAVVVAAAQQVGETVVTGLHRESAQRLGAGRIIADARRLAAVVERQGRGGHGVAVVAARAGPWFAADVAVGVCRPDLAPPWGADLLCGADLEPVVTLLQAVAAAKDVARRGVELSAYGSVTAALLAMTGHSSRSAHRASLGVDAAALVGIGDGVLSARRVAGRPMPPPPDTTPWHALDTATVLDRLRHIVPDGSAPSAAGEPASLASGLARASLTGLATPLTAPLATGAGLSAVLGSISDAALIGAVTGLNAMIGSAQQVGADRALRRLVRRSEVRVRVVRADGSTTVVADRLVPGDVIELAAGDAVPADCRILRADALETDESNLTGESMPVGKTSEPVVADSVADRRSMLYQGTVVAAGSARAVVVAVGAGTEAGRSGWTTGGEQRRVSGVDQRLDQLTRVTIPIAVGASVALVGAGLLRGRDLRTLLTEAVGLAVAAVPEGLPLVSTVAQLAAARRLSARGALVRRSATLEALGRVDVLCFDKTGTLTEGRIRLHSVIDARGEATLDALDSRHHEVLAAALRATPAASDAAQPAHPTDRAVLAGAERAGVTIETARPGWTPIAERPFEPSRGYHATLGGTHDHHLLSVKGAPEVVLPRCAEIDTPAGATPLDDALRAKMHRDISALARRGFRVLVIAERAASGRRDLSDARIARLRLRGLLALADPVRPTAAGALADLRTAGVDVVMLTGDHPSTAEAIAAELGMLNGTVVTGPELDRLDAAALRKTVSGTAVFARVTPAQKVRIVRVLRECGRVVAVTGDGANDAPAIRLADVGIALGLRGTTAARDAADLVVTDDRLETISAALVEGRALWGSVRDALAVLVGGNLGEIAFTLLTAVAGPRGSALNARQLLLVNLLTDMLPAMALAVRPPASRDPRRLMTEGPQRSLGSQLEQDIAARALATASAATLSWLLARPTGTRGRAGTVALVALVGTQLAQTVVAGRHSPLVVCAGVVSAVSLAGIVQTPGLSQFFGCRPLGPGGWTIALVGTGVGAAAAPLARRLPLASSVRNLIGSLPSTSSSLRRGGD